MVAPLQSSNSGRNQKTTQYQALSTLPISLPIDLTGVLLDLNTQVKGTLPVAHGGTGTTTSTGSGSVVLNTAPTFDTSIEMSEGANVILGTTTGTQIGTSASQFLAFYGQTPAAQPTTAITGAAFVAGVGLPVLDDSTFGGYTLQQIAAALIQEGLLG